MTWPLWYWNVPKVDWRVEHYKRLWETAEKDRDWNKGLLYEAWRTMRGQTKGLQRQRRLIRRLQAENARLRNNMECARASSTVSAGQEGKP